MKNINKIKISTTALLLLAIVLSFSSCTKDLDYKTYGDVSSVVNTPQGAIALVNAAYTGLAGGGDYNGGWDAGTYSWRVQSMMTTDEGVCSWGGDWIRLNDLNYDPDFDWVTHNYTKYTPYISRITVDMAKIQDLAKAHPESDSLLNRYIGELKGLRAFYSEMIYFYYGPFTIITDPAVASNPDHQYEPRPTDEAVVKQIEKDFLEAAAVLPDRFTGDDYGRFSKAAAYTGLMKLYMQDKDWSKAVNIGNKLMGMGYTLAADYQDNFSINSKEGKNQETILAVVCSPTGGDSYANYWLAESLPADYKDPSGISLTAWGGYKMPWTTYDKFNPNDKRLSVLLEKYPTGKDANGQVIYKNARTSGAIGAIPMKFQPDPSGANSQASGVDFPIFRYADVLLMQAESIDMANGGPNAAAYNAINQVRERAGLPDIPKGLSQEDFLKKIQNERLYELWAEGWRRIDLIRWGIFIKTAKEDGAQNADEYKKLLPLPRSVISQSNGIIKQNPGYN